MSEKKFDIKYKGLLSMGYEAMDISNNDMNDMTMDGAFYGFNLLNAPDINYTQVIVTRHNSNWIVQECKDFKEVEYLRSYIDGSWCEWNAIDKAPECDNDHNDVVVVERPHIHPNATPSTHGFMSSADKKKLDIIKINNDGGIVEEHIHEEYETGISDLQQIVAMLTNNKADKNHNHDSRYIPAYSQTTPNVTHDTLGQVWIEINN